MTKFENICITLFCIVIGILFISALYFGYQSYTKQDVGELENFTNNASKFDTSILENWCGAPQGTIRMVGGVFYEQGIIEDEDGNLWGWDGPIDEDGFYLLWIDDMGTPAVEDDEILKLWQEI